MNKKISRNKKWLEIFGLALLFRVGVYILSALIIRIFADGGANYNFWNFVNSWLKWDANGYTWLAQQGYENTVEFCESCRVALMEKGVPAAFTEKGQHLALVFYPLFPWVLRIFNFFIPNIKLAGMIVSTLSYCAGCVYVYNWVKLDHSEKTAANTVVLLSLFPFSFFFGGIMTEGLFLLVSAATLYYIRSHKWWLAILFGALASMTRTQGVLLGIPAGIEWLIQYKPITLWKKKDFSGLGKFVLRGLSLFLILTGYVIYLLINLKVDGYAFSYLVYQKSHWYHSATNPINTILEVMNNAFGTGVQDGGLLFAIWIPEAVIIIMSVLFFALSAGKMRLSNLAYGVAYTLLTYAVTWLVSAGRYTVCCIPLFLAIALVTEKRKWLTVSIATSFGILQVLYLSGFFQNMQIF